MIVYTQLLDAAVADLARRIPLFAHIDPARVLVVAANRTANGRSGALAECIALGLPEEPAVEFCYDPRTRRITGATPWFVPKNRRVFIHGRRMLYVLRFRLPRFANHSPVRSVIHEMLHIGDRCDGTHRSMRHGVWFERYVRTIERDWRRTGDARLIALLDLTFREMQRQYGSVAGRCFKQPFVTPLRLVDSEKRGLSQHPEVQRLGLKCNCGPVRRLPFAFDDARALRLTERDLEYRVFHATGSERIAAELLPAQVHHAISSPPVRRGVYLRAEE